MQTFLPHGSDFRATARDLDNKRLGKQRVECLQILQTLAKGDEARGWKNHPAVKMWRGYESALTEYAGVVCDEWFTRGFREETWPRIAELANVQGWTNVVYPPWIDKYELEITHRGRLHVKSPSWYPQWRHEAEMYLHYTCHNKCDYWWPTHHEEAE